MLSKNKLFIFFSIFFLFGVFINNQVLNFKISFLVLLLFVIFFLNFYIYARKYFSFIVITFIGFIIGILVSYINLNHINSNNNVLSSYLNNGKHNITFEIKSINKIKDHDVEYVSILKNIDNVEINTSINSLLSIPLSLRLKKGDTIETNTKLYSIKSFNGFDYKNFMLSKEIYFKSFVYDFELISTKKQNILNSYISKIRKRSLEIIKEIYPLEEGILLGGILIGARENLPKDLQTDFNNSGLTHFIAVSGFNITILIVFFSFFIKYFPITFRILFITFFIFAFSILVGPSAPVIRASIMGLVGYYVLVFGRSGNSLSIILFTAVIMVFISPYSINYDISFHLSFLAVIGIVYTQGFFKRIFNFLPETLAIREAFVLTLSALSFTLPIMIFNFGQVSILAPFSNIAVTWTIPIAMLLGFLSIIVYLISSTAGVIVGYFTWVLLKWDISVVHFFGNLEWSLFKIDFGIYKNHLEILYFIILIFLIMYFKKPVVQD